MRMLHNRDGWMPNALAKAISFLLSTAAHVVVSGCRASRFLICNSCCKSAAACNPTSGT